MKFSNKFEPIIPGLGAAIIIGLLSFLSLETSTGVWLMISFGPTVFIALVLHKSDIAHPVNIFFGHLICILIGIFFNELYGMSFISMGLSVGISVSIMIYLKCVHPPAAANPLIALMSDVSFEYILFPVITGSLVIIFLSIIINNLLLKRDYPKNFNLNKK